jgi:hypothetical protein
MWNTKKEVLLPSLSCSVSLLSLLLLLSSSPLSSDVPPTLTPLLCLPASYLIPISFKSGHASLHTIIPPPSPHTLGWAGAETVQISLCERQTDSFQTKGGELRISSTHYHFFLIYAVCVCGVCVCVCGNIHYAQPLPAIFSPSIKLSLPPTHSSPPPNLLPSH